MTREADRYRAELESSELSELQEAVQWFAQHPDDAVAAVAALLPLVGHDDETVHQWATSALEDLTEPREADLPEIAAVLTHPSKVHDDVRYWAVTLLGRAGRAAAVYADSVVRILENDPTLHVRQQAARTLGRIGANSPAAKAALAAAAASSDARLARLASEALAAVET